MPPARWEKGAASLSGFVDWFIARSEEALGEYTENVDRFLKQSRHRYRWREDRVQCRRSRAEYHLNMVGAEIMNRSFRRAFLNTEAKAVLVPGCMHARPASECGGHLFAGTVYAFKFEILVLAGKPFTRKFDEATGLFLWKE